MSIFSKAGNAFSGAAGQVLPNPDFNVFGGTASKELKNIFGGLNNIPGFQGIAGLGMGGGGGGYTPVDLPKPPDFSSFLNKREELFDEYKIKPEDYAAGTLDASKYGLDNSAYNKLTGIGLGQENPAWLDSARSAQGIANLDLLENAKREAASATAGAQANLAMTGGLRGGARERLGAAGGDALLGASQAARRQGNLADLGLTTTAGQQQMDILSALPGLDIQRKGFGAGLEQFNIGQTNQQNMFNTQAQNAAQQANIANTLGGIRDKNAQKQFRYGEEMKGAGATANAQAIANAGKK